MNYRTKEKMKRRTFIQYSSILAGSMAMPSLLGCQSKKGKSPVPIGIQLYTLKDVIFNDLKGTLKHVADVGYKELETFSYGDGKIFGIPFTDFVSMCNDLGLTIRSGHYGSGFNSSTSGTLRNGWEQAVADAKAAGQQYMVLPYLVQEERTSIDDYKRVCELTNKSAEVCKQYGLQMSYHNHDFEFFPIETQIPYEVMLSELDKNLVSMEMDIYWVKRAGHEPLDYFKKYPGRFELWHVKDMDKNDSTRNADVGAGSIDFKEIFANSELSGMKYFFLEQEYFSGSQFDSIQAGYAHLNTILS
jgi:sugar phosphate isomerase/epimerase